MTKPITNAKKKHEVVTIAVPTPSSEREDTPNTFSFKAMK
jgi:hypothetical protein